MEIVMNISESKFNMWRATLAVVHLDGVLTEEEKNWGKKRIEHISRLFKLSEDQMTILEDDLNKGGVDFATIIPKITDRSDLAFLVHQIRVVGHLDSDFSAQEKDMYKKISDLVMSKINLEDISQQVQSMELASYHEDNVYQMSNENSIFEKVFKEILKAINPGDYKFPKKK